MAIDIQNSDHRARLARALEYSHTHHQQARDTRQNLIDIYRGESELSQVLLDIDTDEPDFGTLLNLFQKFVRGHLVTLAYYAPRWSVNARVQEARGLDKRVQAFLTRYSELLNLHNTQKQLALDSAFGWAIAKIDTGIAPKGINTTVAPRVYRINPDLLVRDLAAQSIDESSFIGDIYLVPLNEAQEHEEFDPAVRQSLSEYREESGDRMLPENVSSNDAYAEPMTRLVDVYIPSRGEIITWPCPNDQFHQINEDPLQVRKTIINPYSVLSLMNLPGSLEEIAKLTSLRGLHLLTNEMLDKAALQARFSQRNPMGRLGDEQNLQAALDAGDNNPFYVEDPKMLGLYQIPGPDQSIIGLGNMAAQLFSSEAGNLEVALGQSTGADTARQTEALMGQISAVQSIDRRTFEMFLAEIGKKLATLAFADEALEMNLMLDVPHTKYKVNARWPDPKIAQASIDSFAFDIVPYSTSFRTPQERIQQLTAASQQIGGLMGLAVQGAPIDLSAVIRDYSEAFDLVPNLVEWWSAKEPTPQEETANTYKSFAAPPQGSDINYSGSGGQQRGAPAPQAEQAAGATFPE